MEPFVEPDHRLQQPAVELASRRCVRVGPSIPTARAMSSCVRRGSRSRALRINQTGTEPPLSASAPLKARPTAFDVVASRPSFVFWRGRRSWVYHRGPDPRAILAERYARGEITLAEYRERLGHLEA